MEEGIETGGWGWGRPGGGAGYCPQGVYSRPQTERSGTRTLAAIMSVIHFASAAHFQLIERKRPRASVQKYDANQREFIQIAAVSVNLSK